jgi:hypothetical protein
MTGTPGGSSRRSCCHDASAGVCVASGVDDGTDVALAAWVAIGLTLGEGNAVGAAGAHPPSHAANAETAMRRAARSTPPSLRRMPVGLLTDRSALPTNLRWSIARMHLLLVHCPAGTPATHVGTSFYGTLGTT